MLREILSYEYELLSIEQKKKKKKKEIRWKQRGYMNCPPTNSNEVL